MINLFDLFSLSLFLLDDSGNKAVDWGFYVALRCVHCIFSVEGNIFIPEAGVLRDGVVVCI